MQTTKGMAHVDAIDYIELPSYGGCARDRRKAEMPKNRIPYNVTHTVRFIFSDVTFKTNVCAGTRGDAETKALMNLRYTFWPETRLRALGPILRVVIHDA